LPAGPSTLSSSNTFNDFLADSKNDNDGISLSDLQMVGHVSTAQSIDQALSEYRADAYKEKQIQLGLAGLSAAYMASSLLVPEPFLSKVIALGGGSWTLMHLISATNAGSASEEETVKNMMLERQNMLDGWKYR
jgi:hypothetical protein